MKPTKKSGKKTAVQKEESVVTGMLPPATNDYVLVPLSDLLGRMTDIPDFDKMASLSTNEKFKTARPRDFVLVHRSELTTALSRRPAKSPLEIKGIISKTSTDDKPSVEVSEDILDQKPEKAPSESATHSEKRPEYLAALLATVSTDVGPTEQIQELETVTSEFKQRVIERLQPVLNATVQKMDHDNLDQKKHLSEYVNSELERFGLAVKCPKSGLAGKLKATSGNWTDKGSFYFEVYVDGKRKTPAWSDTLPELQLIDATPARSLETQWQGSVGSKATRKGRRLS